jgi:phage shock protein C
MTEARMLTRSEDDRMIAGVCGGLAAHFGIDATLVRVVFVLLAVFGGSGMILYLVLWLIVPRATATDLPPRDVVRDGVDEGRRMARGGADAAKRGYRRVRGTGTRPDPDVAPPPQGGRPGEGP